MCKDVAVEDGEIFVSDPPAPDVGGAREPKLAPLVSDPRCRFPPDRRTVHGEQIMTAPLVTPTLEHALPIDRDLIHCATFALAWAELQRQLGSEDVLVEPTELSRALGRAAAVAAGTVDSAESFACAGEGDAAVAAIRAELVRRFGDAQTRLLPQSVPAHALVAFALLRTRVAFERPFVRDRSAGLSFLGSRVQCFGHWGGAGASAYAGAATVHRYESPGDFVIELRGRGGASVVVARREGWSTLAEATHDALGAVDRGPGRWARLWGQTSLQDDDIFQVPVVSLRVEASFDELVGKPIVPGDRVLVAAFQTLELDVDEHGARLVSEALALGMKSRRRRGRELVCDGPFLLALRRAGAPAPYFAAWLQSGAAFVPVEPG
ncbi:hypothetical protein [Sorangium sp. So ce693]|uniref:hypothetical protein n=1 Tax=Sorangium sp. So ce693 TaxID=3133318 RepID=UPI003F5D738F